jgi:hypothetical protein
MQTWIAKIAGIARIAEIDLPRRICFCMPLNFGSYPILAILAICTDWVLFSEAG